MEELSEAAPSPLAQIALNIRAERERARRTLSEVARSAGISKSTLSQLEAGAGNPSIETLWAVATALDVSFAQLVATPEAEVAVVRVGERNEIGSSRADHYTASLLAAGHPGERRDLFVISIEPGVDREADAHPRGAVEHVVVGAGRVRVGPLEREVTLGVGDYARFAGDVAHRYQALEPGSWFVLVMQHPAP